jgi:hypothetical protein
MDAAAAWQRRIDREFPDGAVCSWELPADQTPVIYVTPRIVVVDMAGLDPVVRIVPLDRSRVLGPARVISYVPVIGNTGWPPGTTRVRFAEYPGVMYWNPRVPPVLANRLGDQEPGQ